MKNENIFDLKNIEDLPAKLKKQLMPLGLMHDSKLLLSLFEIKDKLTVDEILVGLKRKYNIQKTREWIASTIYNLKRRNLLKVVDGKKKIYEKNKKI